MRYSDNTVFQKFVEDLVEALKYENECREPNGNKLDIPFLISALCEDLKKNDKRYNEFYSDLKSYDEYNIIIEENNYDICKVNIFVYRKENGDTWDEYLSEENFRYEIMFNYDERNWGYCECSPNDPDYREDKHCCGHGCDWIAPSIEVRKSILVSGHSWDGDEHDYWDFEDKFYADDTEENEKKKLAEREYKIKSLKETIENAQKELEKLENL